MDMLDHLSDAGTVVSKAMLYGVLIRKHVIIDSGKHMSPTLWKRQKAE